MNGSIIREETPQPPKPAKDPSVPYVVFEINIEIPGSNYEYSLYVFGETEKEASEAIKFWMAGEQTLRAHTNLTSKEEGIASLTGQTSVGKAIGPLSVVSFINCDEFETVFIE